jgi:hypothetical protein
MKIGWERKTFRNLGLVSSVIRDDPDPRVGGEHGTQIFLVEQRRGANRSINDMTIALEQE